MSNISNLFYRESYFTKKHDENNPNPNLINLTKNKVQKKITDNNQDNQSERSSNEKSESFECNANEEIELYHAIVETIIPIDDKLNNSAIYNIKIRSSLNCNDSWIKSCTLDDLFNFREYLLKYSHYVINLPFPKKSWMRFLPYIGHKYDERNWDILLENKFFLDDFLGAICKEREMYKLSEFVSFFSKPVNRTNSINLYFN